MSIVLPVSDVSLDGPPKVRRILMIDDNEKIHEDYRKVLLGRHTNAQLKEEEAFLFGDEGQQPADREPAITYQIDSANQGEQGLKLVEAAIASGSPYQAAFIDVRMPPGWDGITTAKRIWEVAPDLPVVLCTAYSDHSWEEVSAELTKTDQFLILKKPFDPVALRQIAASQTTRFHLNRVANQKREQLEALVEQRVNEITMTRNLIFFALARLAESRDTETGEHLRRIQAYVRILVEGLQQESAYQDQIDDSFVEAVCRSSVLHDIGKVGVPDKILLKPGRLTSQEFEIMKTHVEIGAAALDDAAQISACSSFLRIGAEIARYHHERFDGDGYPTGLAGTEIPLSARIVAVADVFDALTTKRVYKDAMPADQARKIIESESGAHFDPEVVRVFIQHWKDFFDLSLQVDENNEAESLALESCVELCDLSRQATGSISLDSLPSTNG